MALACDWLIVASIGGLIFTSAAVDLATNDPAEDADLISWGLIVWNMYIIGLVIYLAVTDVKGGTKEDEEVVDGEEEEEEEEEEVDEAEVDDDEGEVAEPEGQGQGRGQGQGQEAGGADEGEDGVEGVAAEEVAATPGPTQPGPRPRIKPTAVAPAFDVAEQANIRGQGQRQGQGGLSAVAGSRHEGPPTNMNRPFRTDPTAVSGFTTTTTDPGPGHGGGAASRWQPPMPSQPQTLTQKLRKFSRTYSNAADALAAAAPPAAMAVGVGDLGASEPNEPPLNGSFEDEDGM